MPATSYFWRVRALFNGGLAVSDWSTVFEFKTSYPKVNSTTMTTLNGIGPSGNRYIQFLWTGVTPAPYTYNITICFDVNMSSGDCVLAKSGVGPGFTWGIQGKQNIATGTTLYWSVRADGPWGPGLWSNVKTATAP